MEMKTITWDQFESVEIRVGTIIEARDFVKAIKPAYQLEIDFGDGIGVKKSSAQITSNYSLDDLIGQQVLAVVNFPAKQIGNFMSECLVLGVVGNCPSDVTLIQPNKKVSNGLRVL